jgi:ABC-type siderophore export system fused ATPase/permease subunit
MSLAVKAYAALAVVLAIAAGVLYVQHLHRKIDKLEQSNTALSADVSAHGAYVSGSKELDRAYRTAKEETREALEANREWADMPVPDAVADRLRKRTDSPE